MPYINVNDAYILDNTGKQVDDAVDYALANSNRNLLDNPFFTVNQRNFTSSTGVNNIYSVDRWYIARGTGTISKTSNGITINGVGASRETTFQQMIDCGDLTGRTVTVSVNDGGTIRQITGVVPARTTSNNGFIRFSLRAGVYAFLYAMATSSAYAYMLQFQVDAGYTIDIRAVKLELGSYSTLANDAPPDYYKELDKCQWYFERIKAGNSYADFGIGVALSTTNAAFLVNMHPKRNNQYTAVTSGVFGAMPGGTITSLVLDKAASNGVLNLYATGTFVANSLYVLRSANDANVYIDINNEL